MDIVERLYALRGTAHDVGLAAIAEIERLRTEHEKLLAAQEAQQRELVIRTHNQARHLEEVQKLRAEIAALQRLVQNDI